MTRELEYPEHAEHSQRDERAGNVLIVCDAESDVVGQYGHHVNDGHHGAHEPATVRGGEQSKPVLHGEDHHAGCVQTEETDLVANSAWLYDVRARHYAARDGFYHVGAYLGCGGRGTG